MTADPDSPGIDLDPDILDNLTAYASRPRGPRAVRSWSVAELLTLLDPTVSVKAIAERMGVKRAVVTFELVRMRRAGLPVPDRPSGRERAPRALAIEDELRSGMTDAEIARRHGVTAVWVRQIRTRAGIPPTTRPWTDDERRTIVANQDRPVEEVAALLDRSLYGVYGERQRLIRQGLIRPLKERTRNPAE